MLLAALMSGAPAWGADIEVVASGLPNDEGYVLARLFASAAGFPRDAERAVASTRAVIEGDRAQLAFSGIAPGIYALVACHDENGNRACDENFLGIPVETVATPNVGVRGLGPPSFEDAKFELPAGGAKIEIRFDG